ncbi:hypothetical protein Hanom_Chr14g01312011 [Helianthus anomalus]
MRVFLWLNLTKWNPHETKMTKIPLCGVYLVRFNHKKLTELGLKDIGHNLQRFANIEYVFCNY